jgi:putative transposase
MRLGFPERAIGAPPGTRDAVVDFVRTWSELTKIPAARFITWICVQRGKFYDWQKGYGEANEHKAWIPGDHWREPWEREAILAFQAKNPLEGYRRLTFVIIDSDAVAASPTTVWRVLSQAGVIDRWKKRPSKKDTGFVQPLKPYEHWQSTSPTSIALARSTTSSPCSTAAAELSATGISGSR